MAAPPGAAVAPDPQVPKLDHLAEELVSNIAARLGSDDLFSLRRTCTALNRRSFHEFGNEYFTSKCFNITTDSLKVLVAISKHEILREKVRTIFISSACFLEDFESLDSGIKLSVRQQQAWIATSRDQHALRFSGDDLKMLTEAFKTLPKLQKLRVIDNERQIDTPDTDVRGKYKVKRTTGRFPIIPTVSLDPGPAYYRHFRHVINITFRAVATSQIQVSDFGISTQQTLDGVAVNSDLAHLRDSILPKLKTAFKKVECLTLAIQSQGVVQRGNGDVNIAATKKYLCNFAHTFGPSLNEVDVRFDGGPNTSLLCPGLLICLDLSNVRKMHLTGVIISAPTLVSCLSKATALADFRISWFSLTTGTWVSILEVLKQCEGLEHLHLMFLSEAGKKVYFLPQPAPMTEDGFGPYDPFGLFPPTADEDDDTEDDDTEDEEISGDTDDEMPALGTGEEVNEEQNWFGSWFGEDPPEVKPDFIVEEDAGLTEYEKVIGDKNFASPTQIGSSERGYYICLSTRREVEVALPVFIDQYNLGADHRWDQGSHPLGMVAAAFNTVLGGGIVVGPNMANQPNMPNMTNMTNNVNNANAVPGPAGAPANTIHIGHMLNNLFATHAPTATNPGGAHPPFGNAGVQGHPPVPTNPVFQPETPFLGNLAVHGHPGPGTTGGPPGYLGGNIPGPPGPSTT